MSRQIAVCSGKGGVGKTFTCINLARALRDLGENVLVVDADMGLANAQLMLGIAPEMTIADHIFGGTPLKDVISNVEDGLHLLPGASGDASLVNLPLNTLSDLSYEILNSFPNTIILFDIAAGISDQNMHLLQICDTRLVVFIDEPASIADSYGVIKLLHRRGHLQNTFLIPNQVSKSEDGKKFHEKMNHLCLSFLGEPVGYIGSISEDDAVKLSVRKRTPLGNSFPNSTAWCNINNIAKKIVSQKADTDNPSF